MPAVEILKSENIFVMDSQRASAQDIRPLRIIILNLMSLKITTETDLIRLLSNTPLQLEIDFLKISGHVSKNTPVEHMRAFYKEFSEICDRRYDGMIITGAPVEQMAFEAVSYWDEVSFIFDWARTHVTSTMYICWAAQAGLYHYYGIPKYPLEKKLFGVFLHQISEVGKTAPLFRGFDDEFYIPHSRHTAIRTEDVRKCRELTIMAEGEVPNMHPIRSVTSIVGIWQKGCLSKCRRIIFGTMIPMRLCWCVGVHMPICCFLIG